MNARTQFLGRKVKKIDMGINASSVKQNKSAESFNHLA